MASNRNHSGFMISSFIDTFNTVYTKSGGNYGGETNFLLGMITKGILMQFKDFPPDMAKNFWKKENIQHVTYFKVTKDFKFYTSDQIFIKFVDRPLLKITLLEEGYKANITTDVVYE